MAPGRVHARPVAPGRVHSEGAVDPDNVDLVNMRDLSELAQHAGPLQSCASVPRPEDEVDEQLQRIQRHHKRHLFILKVRCSHLYCACSAAGVNLPTEPDPDDRTISKRAWEAAVATWRGRLRSLTEIADAAAVAVKVPPEPCVAADKLAEPAVPLLKVKEEPNTDEQPTGAKPAGSLIIDCECPTQALISLARSMSVLLPPIDIDALLPEDILEHNLGRVLEVGTLSQLKEHTDKLKINLQVMVGLNHGCAKALGDLKRHVALCKKQVEKDKSKATTQADKVAIAKAKEDAIGKAKQIVEERVQKQREVPPVFTMPADAFDEVKASNPAECKFSDKEWLKEPRLVNGLPSGKTFVGTDLMQRVLCNFAGS